MQRIDVFAPQTITLQPICSCQPAFSAAAIAHKMMTWLNGARLDVVSHLRTGATPTPQDMQPLTNRLRSVNEKLHALLAQD